MSTNLPTPWRVPLLVLGMLSLVGGVVAGLIRMGWGVPLPGAASVLDHGPLMVCGFFGTVISLERAVALGTGWAYLAPLCSGLGGLAVLVGAGAVAGPTLLLAGSLILLAASLRVYFRQRALHTLTLVLGAAAWAAGNALWLAGQVVPMVAPLWLAFLVITIAGERLELSRFLPPSPVARGIFGAIMALMLLGALSNFISWINGLPLFAASLLALAIWLLRQDIARRTVREQGLTRFIAVCLLSGYAWLAIGALIMLVTGMVPGSPGYDAGLHAIVLGFVFAMVFGHAPIIFPAVLGVRLPYHTLFYGPLVVLHLSVAVRVVGALMALVPLRSAGGLLNAAALVLFVLGMVSAAVRGSRGA